MRKNYTSAWIGSVIGISVSEQAYVKLPIPFIVLGGWAVRQLNFHYFTTNIKTSHMQAKFKLRTVKKYNC